MKGLFEWAGLPLCLGLGFAIVEPFAAAARPHFDETFVRLLGLPVAIGLWYAIRSMVAPDGD
jgi:hypothetical protein